MHTNMPLHANELPFFGVSHEPEPLDAMRPTRIALPLLAAGFMLAPSLARAQSRRSSLQAGIDLIQKGRESEALSVFRKLSDADPKFMEAWNNRAALEASKGDIEAAQISLQKALAAHPDISVVTRNLEKVRSRLARLAYDSAFGTPSNLPPLVLDLQREPMRLALDTASQRQRDSLAKVLAQVRSAARQDLTRMDSVVSGRDAEIRRLRTELERTNGSLASALQQTQELRMAAASTTVSPRPDAPVAQEIAAAPAPSVPEIVAAADPVRTSPAEPKIVKAPLAKSEPPSPTKPKPKAPETSAAVLAAMQGWAQAWSAQDVDQYLSYYSTRFVPPGQPNREAWEASRRARITAPKSIRVEIVSPKIRMLKGHQAEVVYRQSYQTEETRLTSRKHLVLAWENGVWRIFAEKEAR
jgi:colicin import membrane protein